MVKYALFIFAQNKNKKHNILESSEVKVPVS